jgi:hypothetical protein
MAIKEGRKCEGEKEGKTGRKERKLTGSLK